MDGLIKLKDLTRAGSLTHGSLFLIETSDGTRAITKEDLYSSLCPDGAAAHNEMPPLRRNLTNIYTIEEICTRISDGTFRDLFIGDYFDITISTEFTASEVIRCVFAHFDYYWNCGDTPFRQHHAVIVPQNAFSATAKMNETNTTEGGYHASPIISVLDKYATAINQQIHCVLTHKDLLTNATNATTPSMGGAGMAGASSGWAWYNTTLCLMSEIQVYGSKVWSSAGYDTGCANRQLALFKHDPTALVCKAGGTGNAEASNRIWWWLRDVASASYFCNVADCGNSSCHSASSAGGVRPLFCIG